MPPVIGVANNRDDAKSTKSRLEAPLVSDWKRCGFGLKSTAESARIPTSSRVSSGAVTGSSGTDAFLERNR